MRKGSMLVAGLLTVLALPAAASADHHLLLIREFYPGPAATANDAFLELQMYAPGQKLVGGHEIYVEGGDADPPQTKITKGPKGKIEKSKTRFAFKSDEADSKFDCKRDRRPWRPCDSPKKLKRLDDGRHRFKVRAIDPAGNTDPTPAKRRFEVRR